MPQVAQERSDIRHRSEARPWSGLGGNGRECTTTDGWQTSGGVRAERGRVADVRARGSRNGGGMVAAAAVWMTGQDGAHNGGEEYMSPKVAAQSERATLWEQAHRRGDTTTVAIASAAF